MIAALAHSLTVCASNFALQSPVGTATVSQEPENVDHHVGKHLGECGISTHWDLRILAHSHHVTVESERTISHPSAVR